MCRNRVVSDDTGEQIELHSLRQINPSIHISPNKVAFRLNPKQSLREPVRPGNNGNQDDTKKKQKKKKQRKTEMRKEMKTQSQKRRKQKRDQERMQLSKDTNLAAPHQCVMLFKVKHPPGTDSDNRLHQRPSASHGPPDTYTQRDVVRPISFSACLPDAKPEWRWQRKEGMRARQRQIELSEEGKTENIEHNDSSRRALHPFNAALKHYKNLASVYSQVHTHI